MRYTAKMPRKNVIPGHGQTELVHSGRPQNRDMFSHPLSASFSAGIKKFWWPKSLAETDMGQSWPTITLVSRHPSWSFFCQAAKLMDTELTLLQAEGTEEQ